MKKPLTNWVLLIPWLFILVSANRFKSRGASLISSNPVRTYYYYDPITPVNVRQRRQRQFGADQTSPIVVLQTGRNSPATVQIKELPPLIRSRQVSGFFVPPTTPAASTSFARFNQFGANLFTISPASAPAANSAQPASSAAAALLPENRFEPVLKTTKLPPIPEAGIGRVPSNPVPTLPSLLPETSRTLFGGFTTSRSTTPTSASTTLSTTILSQRPTPLTTTRFLRPRVTSSSIFQR